MTVRRLNLNLRSVYRGPCMIMACKPDNCMNTKPARELDIDRYRIAREPFYAEVRGEVGLFTIAAQSRMPVCSKGRRAAAKRGSSQHMAMAWSRPLITVACHEDLTASDLVGRYFLKGQETLWMDGP